MALDFVWAHPENFHFTNGPEKVQHLCNERGIASGALPAKLFRGRDGSALTRRYFLDRFLLFSRPGTKELAFCYIDSGFEARGPFATDLRRYLPLFTKLGSFELVYVTTSSARLGQAQTVFERVLSRGRKWLTKVADPERLLAHFRDRQLFEKRETSDFDRLRLDTLRDDKHCFLGGTLPKCSRVGRSRATRRFGPKSRRKKMPNGRFSSLVLAHDYDLFGRIEEAS